MPGWNGGWNGVVNEFVRAVRNAGSCGGVRVARPLVRGCFWAFLLFLALALGCSGDTDSRSETRASARARPLDAIALCESGVAVWLDGPAFLRVRARGRGTIEWTVVREGGASDRQEVQVSEDEASLLPIPGSGARVARLQVAPQASVELIEAVLLDGAVPDDERTVRGSARERDVVIVVADALNALELRRHGGAVPTPNLDRLADEGVSFRFARSQTAWTVPSIASMFTGLEQESHGVRDVGKVLDPEQLTLAETFLGNGYATAGFVQNGLLTADSGLAQGFEHWEVFDGERRDRFQEAVTEHLQSAEDRPRFTYVHYLPPHEPYRPPQAIAERLGADLSDPAAGTSAQLQQLNRGRPRSDDPAVQSLRALYHANIVWLDELVGALMDTLREMPQPPLVLFTADHGEAMGQHGFLGHNVHVFEEMVRVPFVFWAPDLPWSNGAECDVSATLLDIPPTLEQLCDLSLVTPRRQGRSLVPWIIGESDRTKLGIGPRRLSARFVPRGSDSLPLQRAIVFGEHKLLEDGRGGRTLYDLVSDPAESTDVTGERPLLAEVLADELDRWQVGEESGGSFTPDERLQRELERLGYLRPEIRGEATSADDEG